MFWGWPNWGWGGMFLMMFIMFIFWGGLIALALLGVWAFTRSRPGPLGTGSRPTGNALEILKERYARGEITKEEYLRMRDDLLR